ncbi:hypothetical protein BD410DRAFT_640014 [Rickenella mellea]|uniref:histidine kinase n=1 Tax=Rickenella mellea TaxID=50990 RepID=A0A4Y7QE27_9AGAM|nr:hypothetical protein BD410DRAFT_640014 [Rickenella mellea]
MSPLPSSPSDLPTVAKCANKRKRRARRVTVDSFAVVVDNTNLNESPCSPSLPLPASAQASKENKKIRNARIGKETLSVRWARFKQRIGTSTGLSESILDGGAGSTDTSYSARRQGRETDDNSDESDEVDQVVVENELFGDKGSVTQPSEDGRGDQHQSRLAHQSSMGTQDSMAGTHHTEGFWESNLVLTFFRWRLWPTIVSFFTLRFHDDQTEESYCREAWFTSRSAALYCTTFFILNWILVCALGARPFSTSDNIFYYGAGAAMSLPLPFFIMFELPRLHPRVYQIYLFISVWSWSYYLTSFMFSCHFYSAPEDHCGTRDFLALFYYAIGLPTMAMVTLGMTRISFCIGATVTVILNLALIAPEHTTFVRNIINMILFYTFLLYQHYKRETMDRRLYSLRSQLKIQFRATQKAQVNERKASDSKRRLTSYVFHEVRVPLNTALLALQNLEATGTIAKEQGVEWAALGGSLAMMSKVLNDVLDFNRLDSGRFSTVKQPYNFHQAIHAMLVPLRLAANARGLHLQIDLDRNIDKVARIAALQSMGKAQAVIEQDLQDNPDDGGIVLGDEMRLRQVVTNLASNACKFTSTGGQIKIVTKLVYPSTGANPVENPRALPNVKDTHHEPATEKDHANANRASDGGSTSLSILRLAQHNDMNEKHKTQAMDKIVVRIEVHDTGVGIKSKDLVDHKLFSPYVQTEIGKHQGGKGTGLGLALVRRIVKLGGGRLGVKSKAGQGSEFWVEIPLGVGSNASAQPGFKQNVTSDGSEHSGGHTMERVLDVENIDFWVPRDDHYSSLALDSEDAPPPKTSLQNSFNPQADSALKTMMEHPGLVRSSTGVHAPMPAILSLAKAALTQQFTHSPSLSNAAATIIDIDDNTSASTVPDSKRDGNVLSPSSFLPSTSPSILKVLVVDDDPLTRKLMTRMLSRLGCVIETAENGKIALEMIIARPAEQIALEETTSIASTAASQDVNYDVVFLDNQMPVMSGVDMVLALRGRGRTEFVVGVTGNALMSDQQEYLEAGVDRVLTKPVFEQSLKAMLQMAEQRRTRIVEANAMP